MEVVKKAKIWAEKYFAGITEKNPEKTPYILHLARVAKLVEDSGGSEVEIAAAWLHDIIEDTPVTIEEIFSEFGEEVGKIVNSLTDLPEYSRLSVVDRKQRQLDKIRKASDSVKMVKLADQISAVEIDSKNVLLSIEHRLKYCEGAKKIARICEGINSYLDDEFANAHLDAILYLRGSAEAN